MLYSGAALLFAFLLFVIATWPNLDDVQATTLRLCQVAHKRPDPLGGLSNLPSPMGFDVCTGMRLIALVSS